MTALALLLVIEGAFLYAAHRSHWTVLRTHMVVNMLLIALFGGVMLPPLAGMTSNAGNVCYASAVAALYLIWRSTGWRSALGTSSVVFASLLMIYLVTHVMRGLLLGGTTLDGAYAVVIDASHRFTVASFVAFWLGQGIFIALLEQLQDMPMWLHYGIAVVAAQLADSAVFFLVAFGAEPAVIEIAAAGLVLKVVLGLAAIPMLAWLAGPPTRVVRDAL